MEDTEVELEMFICTFCFAWKKNLVKSQEIIGVEKPYYINKWAVIFIIVKSYLFYLISSIFKCQLVRSFTNYSSKQLVYFSFWENHFASCLCLS